MRFSGSIYDNLRQPGVFKDIEQRADNNRNHMKRAVLARLRFDDLLSNDSENPGRNRIVASFSDLVDGRLFTLLKPGDLEGIKLEIFCAESLAKDSASAVIKAVRAWIHKEDGQGLPAFFMAARDGSTRADIARALEQRSDLNVNSLEGAIGILEQAGLAQEDGEELERHWYNCIQAIGDHRFEIKTFLDGKSASAEATLRLFLEKKRDTLWEKYGIDETGKEIFGEALECLKESGGKRDKPVKFLLDQLALASNSNRGQVETVQQIFFHHMFESISRANNGVPEHSAAVGQNDNWASPTDRDYLLRLDEYEGACDSFKLDERVVSALGGISGSEYSRIREAIAPDIWQGIRAVRRKQGLSHLEKALGKLASEVGKEEISLVSKPIDKASRIYLWPAVGALTGTVLEIVLDPAGKRIVPTVGAVSGAAVGQMVGKAIGSVSRWLLKKSLVREALKELTGKRVDT